MTESAQTRDGWFRASSDVARIAASATGVRAAFTEAATLLQSFAPIAVSLVAAPKNRSPQCFVHGFSEAFSERLTELYLRGYRLTEPVKGAMNVRSDYVLWPELALEGMGLFAAWPLMTAGRSVGELHIGLYDSSDPGGLPPDEFMETFSGALALAVDRNELLSLSEHQRDTFQWHQKLTASMVHGREDAVLVTDNLGRVMLLNPAAEVMLNLREGAVLGRRLSEADGRFNSMDRADEPHDGGADRTVVRAGEEGAPGIEGFRFSSFEHGGRRYISWILRRTPVLHRSAAFEKGVSELDEGVRHERLAVLSCDENGRILARSDALAELVGALPGKLADGGFIGDCTALRVSGIADAMKRCLQSGEPGVTAHELYHRSRGTLHLSVHCTPIFRDNRALAGVQAVIEDATDIVRTRTSLLRSEERYRIFFNNAPIGLVELDLSAVALAKRPGVGQDAVQNEEEERSIRAWMEKIRVAAVNPAAAAMYGAPSPAVLSESWVGLNRGALGGILEMLDAFDRGLVSAAFEGRCETATGEPMMVSVRAAVAPGHEQDLSRVLVSIMDIGRIKSMEQVLRLQLALERLVSRVSARFVRLPPDRTSEGIADAMAEVGTVLGLDTVALYERFGTSALSARHIWTDPQTGNLPLRIASLMSSDYPAFADAVRALKAVRVDRPDDLPVDCNERKILEELNIAALLIIPLAVQGRFRGVLALSSRFENRWEEENVSLLRVLADVLVSALDREERERERRESEDLLQAVFHGMVGGLLVADPNGVVVFANPSAAASFRLSGPEELVGKGLKEALPGAEGMLRSGAAGAQQQIVLSLKDGVRCTFGFTCASDAGGRHIVLFRDLSPMIQAAERQKRAEELARLGMMTAKLSHEIKNPLASILLGLRTLEESDKMGDDDKFLLKSVLDEVRYLKSFMGNLLDSTRFQDTVPTPQKSGEILRQVMKSQSHAAVRSGVSLRLSPSLEDTIVCADSRALVRAMGNLVTNAREACGSDGWVEVGCRILTPEETERRFPGFAGETICFYVEDNGPGMPVEVMDNLFVPFTTTKSFGNGLGLSVVRETVSGHGGVIEVITPTEGGNGGTRFEILLAGGERPSCLDVHGTSGECAGCPVPSGCPVREVDGYLACWVIKGRASLAETGRWNEECMTCPAYAAGNLEHFYRRPGQRGGM